MAKRDLLTEFQTYYQSLSPDAQEIVRRLVLSAPVKPKSPAAGAGKRSAPSKRGLPSAASTETEKAIAGAAVAGSSGGGD